MRNLLRELVEELRCNGYSLCDILYASCMERSESDSLFSHRVVLRPEVFLRAAEKINYDRLQEIRSRAFSPLIR